MIGTLPNWLGLADIARVSWGLQVPQTHTGLQADLSSDGLTRCPYCRSPLSPPPDSFYGNILTQTSSALSRFWLFCKETKNPIKLNMSSFGLYIMWPHVKGHSSSLYRISSRNDFLLRSEAQGMKWSPLCLQH